MKVSTKVKLNLIGFIPFTLYVSTEFFNHFYTSRLTALFYFTLTLMNCILLELLFKSLRRSREKEAFIDRLEFLDKCIEEWKIDLDKKVERMRKGLDIEYPEDGDNSGKCPGCLNYPKIEGHKENCKHG